MESKGGVPSRRERRQQQRDQKKQVSSQLTKGIGRRAFIAGAVGTGAVVLGGATLLLNQEQDDKRSFKEKVNAFSWEDVKNSEKMKKFTEMIAKEYLRLSNTSRLILEDLVGEGKTNYYYNRKDFQEAVMDAFPQSSAVHEWGYADFEEKKIYVDIEELKKQSIEAGATEKEAGVSFLSGIWHEWGHLDVQRKTAGRYINNPQALLRPTPDVRGEMIRSYRGGRMYSDSFVDYQRWDEVLNETIIQRRISEQAGFTSGFAAKGYYENGVDIFYPFSKRFPLERLYNLYATSDVEGQGDLVGSQLPGSEQDFLKGERLFIGIHKNDPSIIARTQIYSTLPARR